MRKTILTAAALLLFSSPLMAQSKETKSPATTGPAAQSDNMTKGVCQRYNEQEKET
jgi:hypothetical protein